MANGKITVNAGALDANHSRISVGSNYALELGNDVAQVATINFAQNGNAVTLSGTSAGYAKSGNAYEWQEKSGGETLTIIGLKSGAVLTENNFSRANGQIIFKPTDSMLPVNPSTISITGGVIDTSGLTVTPAETAHRNSFTYVAAKTASSWTTGSDSVSYTAASGGEELFKIEGLSAGTTLTNPVAQASSYSITLPTATSVKIVALNANLDGSTINAGGVSNLTAEFAATVTTSGSAIVNGVSYISAGGGLTISTTATSANLTSGTIKVIGEQVGVKVSGDSDGVTVAVSNSAVTSITGLNSGGSVTYGGKTYTRTGDYISDGKNYYAATDATNILEMAAASNYIEIANDTINLSGVNSGAIFGVNGEEVEKYIGGVLTISGTGIYAVKTTGGVTIGSETYTSSGALEISANVNGSSLTNGTVTVKNSLKTSDGKTISVSGDSDGVTVAVENGTVKSVSGLAAGGSVTYDGKTYRHTINLPFSATASGDKFVIDGKDYYASGAEITVSNFAGGEISFDSSITSLQTANGNIIAGDLTIKGLTFAETENIWTVAGDKTLYCAKTTAGAEISGAKIVYSAENVDTANPIITLGGISTTDGISLSGKVVTVSAAALNQKNVTISEGYTLALAAGIAAPVETAAHFDGNVYKSASNTAGYTLADNQITYTAAVEASDLFTLSGVANIDGVTVSGTTVTLTAENLEAENVTIEGGNYQLAMTGVTASTTTPAKWTLSGTTATYISAATTAGYTLKNNQISYAAASGGETLATVDGVKSLNGITLNNKTVTVSAKALNEENMTISGSGYKLALADGVASPKTTSAAWNFSGTTATYISAATTAGYTLKNNQISYVSASGGETLVTVNGVKSLSGIKLNNKKVTVSASALNEENVTISGSGYKLALANGVAAPKTTAAAWHLNGTTATYKAASTSAGYTLKNNQISYTAASGGETLTTVTNVKSLDGISLNGKVITVSATALNQKKVTVSEGYTLALGKDVAKPSVMAPTWTIKNSSATLHADTSDGYTLDDNEIIYSAQKTGDSQIVLAGIAANATLALPANKILTLDASALGKNGAVKSNAGNFAVKVTGDMSGKTFTGTSAADNISIATGNAIVNGGSGNDSISGGTGNDKLLGGEGNDTLKGGSGNDTLSGGSGSDKLTGGSDSDTFVFIGGSDTITNYAAGEDKISISSSLKNGGYSVSKKNVILSCGEDSLTIANGVNKKIEFADGSTAIYTEAGRFDENRASVTLSPATQIIPAS